jgi:translation initiation factor IF-1
MVALSKLTIVGFLSCGVLLCLGPSNAAQADDNEPSASDVMKTYSQTDQHGFKEHSHVEDAKTIKGEVLRVEGDNYFVKESDGKEVRMHIDQTTKMGERNINQGDVIEAQVNDQNHALSILSPDRRSDHALQPGQANSVER